MSLRTAFALEMWVVRQTGMDDDGGGITGSCEPFNDDPRSRFSGDISLNGINEDAPGRFLKNQGVRALMNVRDDAFESHRIPESRILGGKPEDLLRGRQNRQLRRLIRSLTSRDQESTKRRQQC